MLMIFRKQSTSGSLSAVLIISGVLLVVGVTFLMVFLPRILWPTTTLRLGDGVFNTRLALNNDNREKGLSGVEKLNSDQALLMAYPSDGEWGIWMKDMLFPIDIVWLDNDKRVIYIVKNVSPDEGVSITRKPNAPAKYVVELPAGTVDNKSISVNKVAIFQLNLDDIE